VCIGRTDGWTALAVHTARAPCARSAYTHSADNKCIATISQHDKFLSPVIDCSICARNVSAQWFRCESVSHLEFSKFEICDDRPSLWTDFASLYRIPRKSYKPPWIYRQRMCLPIWRPSACRVLRY